MDKRQMVLFSGGGWHYSNRGGYVMDEWLLSLTGKTRPKVCLLATPAGDSDTQLARMFKQLRGRCEIVWAPMFQELAKGEDPIENMLTSDLIYIPGGYAQASVAALRAAGWENHLRQAWENGVIIAAMCAGAMTLSQNFANQWMSRPGIGEGLAFQNFSFTAHAQVKLYEDLGSLFRHGVRDGLIVPGYRLEDGFALRFRGNKLIECVTSEYPNPRGWWVEPGKKEHELIEKELYGESLEERLRIGPVEDYFTFVRDAKEIPQRERRALLRKKLQTRAPLAGPIEKTE
jgi:dipeptidase E